MEVCLRYRKMDANKAGCCSPLHRQGMTFDANCTMPCKAWVFRTAIEGLLSAFQSQGAPRGFKCSDENVSIVEMKLALQLLVQLDALPPFRRGCAAFGAGIVPRVAAACAGAPIQSDAASLRRSAAQCWVASRFFPKGSSPYAFLLLFYRV